MKFSLKWLADFIDTASFFNDPNSLSEALTQAGLEVEAFEDQKSRFQNVVLAELKSVEKHPQADRLTLCEVFDGSKDHSIVCGAKNHKSGDKVVLALPGAVLPGDFAIKKTRIRGVESEGMLASCLELGFEQEEKEGLWILPKEAKTGMALSEYLGLEDVIFDIAVPPNRSDCLSHKGLAREISCLFSIPFSEKKFSIEGTASLSVKKSLKVEVKDNKSCPRYCGRLIEGIQVKESPLWLKERLKSLGLKSINNVVDITNFVLWDRGQPLHAFDRNKIQSLTVDKSQKAEKFLALDENELALTGEELSIRDENRVLALAGVIGGMDSSITEETKNIFIESACFAPEKIRRASRRFGLETESSYRFARGIDITSVQEAMDLACYLIQKEAGGSISEDFYDIYSEQSKPEQIKISLDDLETRLGYRVQSSQFQNWMERLSCKVIPILFENSGSYRREKTEKAKPDQYSNQAADFKVTSPSYRTDLKIKEDLIEEFARLEGYDKIPETLPSLIQQPEDSDSYFLNSQKLIQFLSGKGWLEAVNYSFSDPDYYREFLKEKFFLEGLSENPLNRENNKTAQDKKTFPVDNPISRQFSLMKPLLAPDLMRNIVSNFRHNNKSGQLFELSPVFYQEGEEYKQESHLGLALWGSPVDIWKSKDVPNFYQIKSVLESAFEAFRIKGCLWKNADISFLHPKQSLVLSFKNKILGFLGSLHPKLQQKYKIPLDIALAEIHWGLLDQELKKPLRFKAFSSLPSVEKDLCFVIPPAIAVGDVSREIKKTLGSLCEKIEVFDIYEKQEERFVSFRMYLTPQDKSWTDEQLQDFLNQVIQNAHKKFSIRLKSEI